MNNKIFYENQIQLHNDRIKHLQNSINVTTIGRSMSFLLLAAGVYLFFHSTIPIALTCCIVGSSAFLWFLKRYFLLKDERQLEQQLLFVYKNELAIAGGAKNRFSDGSRFMKNEGVETDLDVFGPSSLFHMLNRSVTTHGFTALQEMLVHPFTNKKTILDWQEAVKQLSPQAEKRALITATALVHHGAKQSLSDVDKWLQTKNPWFLQKGLSVARYAIPVLTIVTGLTAITGYGNLPFYICVAVSWALTAMHKRYIGEQQELVSKKQEVFEQYAGILNAFSKTEAGSSIVLQRLHVNAEQASNAVRKLARLVSYLEQRQNLLVYIFLNSLLLYDIQCMISIEKWKGRWRDALPGWIQCVGEIECLQCLATFTFNNLQATFPEPVDMPLIRAADMIHPLMILDNPTANNFSIGKDHRLQIITGSNMSGKTTFLRAVGVNLILARCGAPVCASSFQFYPFEILSCIRVSDSLQEHTSYFMAELKRLQHIIHSLEKGMTALVLVDEILRGTNSDDKTNGSEKFIGKLLSFSCVSMFATHDLALGKLEEQFPNEIKNYCFESRIEDGQLSFDFRLREGVAKNKNASFLMTQMGII